MNAVDIVVAEDSRIQARMLQKVLVDAGHTVRLAEDGGPLLIRLPSPTWPTSWWQAPPAAARLSCCGR